MWMSIKAIFVSMFLYSMRPSWNITMNFPAAVRQFQFANSLCSRS